MLHQLAQVGRRSQQLALMAHSTSSLWSLDLVDCQHHQQQQQQQQPWIACT